MFFHDKIVGFIQDRYRDLDAVWQRRALLRNLGWAVDLEAEHTISVADDPDETRTYAELPAELMEHDQAIQARMEAFEQGIQLGVNTLQVAVETLAIFIRQTVPNLNVDALTKLHDLVGTNIRVMALHESERVGLPEFMIPTLADTIDNAANVAINTGFGLNTETTTNDE